MKKFPKPWLRESRNIWVVTLDGKQHNLGPDEDVAFEEYKRLLNSPKPKVVVRGRSVVDLIDLYLDWCNRHRSSATFEWYRSSLQLFVKTIDKNLDVEQLKHYHIDQWLDAHPGWSSGTKHGMVRRVQRALNWAVQKGHIDRSPVAYYEKPRPGKRTKVVSPDEFDNILKLVRNPRFRDLLTVSWHTGCRPQESLIVGARHFDEVNSRWIFPAEEAKGGREPRIVYVTGPALEITKRLVKRWRSGPMFRNSNDKPWTTDAVNCYFHALRVRMGRRVMKDKGLDPSNEDVQSFAEVLRRRAKAGSHLASMSDDERCHEARRRLRDKMAAKLAPGYCLYNLRHSWATRALKSGLDPLTTSLMLGHRDPTTMVKHYQHLSQSPEYFLEAAAKVAAKALGA